MIGTSQEIALLVVEAMGALALALLWLGGRERAYTLWWAIAHMAQPILAVLAGVTHANPNSVVYLQGPESLLIAIQAVGLLAGVISYRTTTLRPVHVAAAVVLLGAVFYLPALWLGVTWERLSAIVAMSAALLTSAALMWTMGSYERIAAVCLGARGVLNVGLLVFIVGGLGRAGWVTHFASINAPMTIGTALALIVAAYQRSLEHLREQYRIIDLSQKITAQLRGALDEREVAGRALTALVQRLGGMSGVFLRPGAEPLSFVSVATVGVPAHLQARADAALVKVDPDGLISEALATGRVAHATLKELGPRGADKSNPDLADFHSQVVIPVNHDGINLGVIVVRNVGKHQLHETEINTLESLGQVIGLSLANAANLRELAYRANHDALTGLGNRAALHDYLRGTVTDRCVVLLFDLDRFKQVNDVLGHTVGDKLLSAMAERLVEHFRGRAARLFRLGGDEFVVIHKLSDAAGNEESLAIARELAETIAAIMNIGDLKLRTPASIGAAIAPEHGTSSHELLRCADVAMYHAKSTGFGIAIYNREIDAYKLEHLTLLSAVGDGLNKGQFELFYQPFVNLKTGAIEGCEGLIRWHHPALGLITASAFMPLVEATDLIQILTHNVIDMAMADSARWQARGIDCRISINLSVRNILDLDLLGYLIKTAELNKVDPGRIQLEITETVLIKDPVSAGRALQRLSDAGFTLALDDFGTGYSSLAYLARFPIHTLKIDRSFVREMLDRPQSRAIVESTISLARGLGLTVTAEGVEREEEAQLLRELGCNCGQGYLFCDPLPAARFLEEWEKSARTVSAL